MNHGAVGTACSPSIVVSVLKKELALWNPTIQTLVASLPQATGRRDCLATDGRDVVN